MIFTSVLGKITQNLTFIDFFFVKSRLCLSFPYFFFLSDLEILSVCLRGGAFVIVLVNSKHNTLSGLITVSSHSISEHKFPLVLQLLMLWVTVHYR